jgi:hypothetical protein
MVGATKDAAVYEMGDEQVGRKKCMNGFGSFKKNDYFCKRDISMETLLRYGRKNK